MLAIIINKKKHKCEFLLLKGFKQKNYIFIQVFCVFFQIFYYFGELEVNKIADFSS